MATLDTITGKCVILDCRASNSQDIVSNEQIVGVFPLNTADLFLSRLRTGLITLKHLFGTQFPTFQQIIADNPACTICLLDSRDIGSNLQLLINATSTMFPDNLVVNLKQNITKSVQPTVTFDTPADWFETPDAEVLCGVRSEILPGGLYLTGIDGVSEKDLIANGITHVVSVIEEPPRFSSAINHLFCPLTDTGNANISQYFEESFSFIDACITSGKPVVVHCLAGISRSATLVIAYLMRKQRKPYLDVLTFVQQKRGIVCPNLGFCLALRDFETYLATTSS